MLSRVHLSNLSLSEIVYEVLSGEQPCQHIKIFRRFEDQLRPHLLGARRWELVLETSEYFNVLARLLARENFIEKRLCLLQGMKECVNIEKDVR